MVYEKSIFGHVFNKLLLILLVSLSSVKEESSFAYLILVVSVLSRLLLF